MVKKCSGLYREYVGAGGTVGSSPADTERLIGNDAMKGLTRRGVGGREKGEREEEGKVKWDRKLAVKKVEKKKL